MTNMNLFRNIKILSITISLVALFFHNNLNSQYYNPTQINSIHVNKEASEGDMYLDTTNKNYYIGLTTGELAKIGDTLDELTLYL